MTLFKTERMLMGAVLGIMTIGMQAHAGDVKLHVDMTGGSFDAKSHQVKGVAKKVGEQFVADQIVVPMGSLDSGNSLRDNHMKNKYLETGKYPNATLTQVKGADGKFTGILTIHGVAKKIAGEYEIKNNEVVATFKTQLTDHKIAQVNYMGIGVEDEVEVTANVPIEMSRLPASK